MSLLGSGGFLSNSKSSIEDEFLIKKIFISHDPDGRSLDSELLLRAFETLMSYATPPSQGSDIDHKPFDVTTKTSIDKIEVLGSEEPLEHTIYKISLELLCNCSGGRDLHTKTMNLFDMLRHYRWDSKVVLVLAAFGTIYGQVWLIIQLYPNNPLAALLAMFKHLPNRLSRLRPLFFKALRILVKIMVDVTKWIIKFEDLPMKHVDLDKELMGVTKSQIYIATYWVTRSAVTCSSQIKDLFANKNDQVPSSLPTIATWELSGLICRLSSICSHLRQHVDRCHQLIGTKIHNKLLSIFKETHVDNQEVLRMLFALKNDFPLKHCSSQKKVGVSELKNKVVILLVSKLEFIPMEKLLFLVQQTYDHSQHKKLEGSYEILWVPIPSSNTWTQAEYTIFEFLSNSLPWYSIRQPWLLSSAVLNFIKKEWGFIEEPLMVILDSQGSVTNRNAIDMVLVWGVRAYPFSASRETELWEEDKWTLHLLLGGIDPLLSLWVEEKRNICVYGSDNLDWIREFNTKMREIKSAGVKLEMVYVGNKNLSPHLRNILATIDGEKLGSSINFLQIKFFWLRLESMRRSRLHLGYTDDNDLILKGVSSLTRTDENENGWAVTGSTYGESLREIVKFQGMEFMEWLHIFTIRTGFGAPVLNEPCNFCSVVPYGEGLNEGTLICEKCKRPMEKFVMYKCGVTE